MNILEALDDPQLFGRHFAAPSWRAWRTVLAALFGLPFHGGDLGDVPEAVEMKN